VNEQGQGVPDPEIRRIPEEDEADPARNYVPLAYRLGQWREEQGIRKVPKRRFDGTGRKGSSSKSPRRSARGGSSFDIGPRRPREQRNPHFFSRGWI
jgi:hypothetical protein